MPETYRDLLCRPLEVTAVRRASFASGVSIRDEIVTTNRLILIARGELLYTVEHRTHRLGAGTQIFVPAWVRRVWSAPAASDTAGEIFWCEFDSAGDTASTGMAQRHLDPSALRQETTAYRALQRLDRQPPSSWQPLHLETNLKVMLARFFEAAAHLDDAARPAEIHPRVKAMLRWLEDHFAERDALQTLYARSELTPNYFRRHFAAATLCTPHDYIERLRLRRARYLLRSTGWQLKRIAVEVGYDDPLYFSRLYRRFWNHPPSAERERAPSDFL